MNLIKMAVLFVIITIPFHMVSDLQVRLIEHKQIVKSQYETIIQNAIDDGTLALSLYSDGSYENEAKKAIQVNANEVLNAFLSSYHYGFSATGEVKQRMVDRYLLALIIVAYDGYYIYGTKRVFEPLTGKTYYRQVLSDKQPFLYEEAGTVVKFTLDHYVHIMYMERDSVTNEVWPCVEGDLRDEAVRMALPPSITEDNFDDIKQYVISSTLEKALTDTVTYHNLYAGELGMSYVFQLPVSDAGGYSRPIKDLSLLTFIQGKEVGFGETLSIASLNESSVLTAKEIYGYEQIKPSGGSDFYYCDRYCNHSNINIYDGITNNEMVKVFGSKEDAALDGFYPCQTIGK